MFRMWLSAVLVLTLCPPAVAQPEAASCVFAGARLPCTVESTVAGEPAITLKPLTRDEWEFLERDMAPEATALHADLLNHTTWDNAQRYALSQLYRQYRAVQAMKLATYARAQIMARVRAKYGDLDEFSLLEAVVIEAGLPVIHVPDLDGPLMSGETNASGNASSGEVPGAK